MKVSRSDIESNLPRKGFRKVPRGRDHIWLFHEYGGRETGPRTKVSRSSKLKDYAGDLLTQVRKQLHLDRNEQVVDLVECPLDGDAYNKILIAKGVFDPSEVAEQSGKSDDEGTKRGTRRKRRRRG